MNAPRTEVQVLDKFKPLVTRKKRIKIILGGRGSTKSTFIADYVLACMDLGQLWCCAREFQNSIEESVHRVLMDEVERIGLGGFKPSKTDITHVSGGRNFYKGLARNITTLKSSLSGVSGLWIEEGESLSESTLRVLTASVRNSAKDAEKYLEQGIDAFDVPVPEIWISMNRGSRNDPISKKYLARAETQLEKTGFYEDDTVMIVEANYTDMPRDWFLASGLEQERLDDFENMPRAMYDHKWLGKYLETIDNAIIQPEWFDACVDAHLALGFEPLGQEVVSYDPADSGDAKARARMHGSVVTHASSTEKGDISSATAWALEFTTEQKADAFTWDSDGIGGGLVSQIAEALKGKKIEVVAFKGSMAADHPNDKYVATNAEIKDTKTNKETFVNSRAQNYIRLADRMYRTYRAIKQKKYSNPEDLISFSSEIEELVGLKSELCRIPRKLGGRIQILSKPDMKKLGIASPNLGDAVMMLQKPIEVQETHEEIIFEGW